MHVLPVCTLASARHHCHQPFATGGVGSHVQRRVEPVQQVLLRQAGVPFSDIDHHVPPGTRRRVASARHPYATVTPAGARGGRRGAAYTPSPSRAAHRARGALSVVPLHRVEVQRSALSPARVLAIARKRRASAKRVVEGRDLEGKVSSATYLKRC